MYKIYATSKYKTDLKKIAKDGSKDINELLNVVNLLAEGKALPAKYKDHPLKGKGKNINQRECHIQSDWLLIYEIDNDILILTLLRTGNHANLLRM